MSINSHRPKATNSGDIRRDALERLCQEAPEVPQEMEEWLAKEAQSPTMSHPYARLLGGHTQPQVKSPRASQPGSTQSTHRSRFNNPPTPGQTR